MNTSMKSYSESNPEYRWYYLINVRKYLQGYLNNI